MIQLVEYKTQDMVAINPGPCIINLGNSSVVCQQIINDRLFMDKFAVYELKNEAGFKNGIAFVIGVKE